MVSLEDRNNYSSRIYESPKLVAFYNLLQSKSQILYQNQDINESDELYFKILNSIQKNNKEEFELYYNKKNKSHPVKESNAPFVNDDFLIFSLILGIVKFNLDKAWIKDIISIRNRSAITITFENILNEDNYSKSNLSEVVLIFLHFNHPQLITNDFQNIAYKSILENVNLFENKSDFQIMCAMRAYDLIIESKESPDNTEMKLLKVFNLRFLRRIKVLSWIVQTIILIAIIYAGLKLISFNPSFKVFFDKIGSVLKILGLIGLSQLGNFFPVIKRKLYEILLIIFGYPKALLEKMSKKEEK